LWYKMMLGLFDSLLSFVFGDLKLPIVMVLICTMDDFMMLFHIFHDWLLTSFHCRRYRSIHHQRYRPRHRPTPPPLRVYTKHLCLLSDVQLNTSTVTTIMKGSWLSFKNTAMVKWQ
jgi:hypothetical protein